MKKYCVLLKYNTKEALESSQNIPKHSRPNGSFFLLAKNLFLRVNFTKSLYKLYKLVKKSTSKKGLAKKQNLYSFMK